MVSLIEFPRKRAAEHYTNMCSPEQAFLLKRAACRRNVSIQTIEAGGVWMVTEKGEELTVPEGLMHITIHGPRNEVAKVTRRAQTYRQLLTDVEQFRHSQTLKRNRKVYS